MQPDLSVLKHRHSSGPRGLGLLVASLMLALACLSPIKAMAQSEPSVREINFGIISTESSSSLKSRWAILLEDMEQSIGVKVNGYFATDYSGVIEAMRFNKVQVGWFGNAAAVQAVDRSEGQVFCQRTNGDGTRGYNSVLITHKDSPIISLDHLLANPGKYTFGNGDPNSTSGFLIPAYYLWGKNNIDIRRHFTRIVNANHETNALTVAMRQVDVATNNTEDLAKLRKAHPDKFAQLREVWRSVLIPTDPIVYRKDLPDALKDKIRTFFITYGRERPGANIEREKAALLALGDWGPFEPSSNAQLLPIRQVMLFKDRLKIEQDEAMNPADRSVKFAEIDAKLTALQTEMQKAAE